MKKILALALALCMLFALCACGQTVTTATTTETAATEQTTEAAADDTVYTLVLAHIQPETHTWHKAFEYLADYCAEKSNGRLVIEIHANSELGTEMEAVQNVISGSGIDICISGESLSTFVPALGVMSVPYAITSDEHAAKVLNGEVGAELADLLTAQGLKPLAAFIRGAREITAKKPITCVDDLNGVIIRTPDTPYTVAAFQNAGAKPVVIAYNELLTALQQGTAEAQENPLANIYQMSFYEAQDYLVLSDHLITWMYTLINPDSFNNLPEDLQQILTDGCAEMQDYEHELFLAEETDLLQKLQDAGMTVCEVDQSEFKEVMQSAVLPLLSEEENAMLEKINALAD